MHDGDIQVGELRSEFRGVGEIRFGQAQNRCDIADESRDQGALDKTRARWGIGNGGDDQHLICIGDDDALVGVGVIGGTTQHRAALGKFHDPGQGIFLAGSITDYSNTIADLDGGAAKLAGAHAHHIRALI